MRRRQNPAITETGSAGTNNQPKMEQYMTIADVARLLKMDYMTIYALVRDKKLGALNVSGSGRNSYRITQKQLNDFLVENNK